MDSFAKSFDELIQSLTDKAAHARHKVNAVMSETGPTSLAQRLRRRATRPCGPTGNVSPNRLGWLDVPRRMAAEADELGRLGGGHRPVDGRPARHGRLLARSRRARGGAGRRGRRRSGRAALVVCDTTDPTTVGALDFSDAFVLVSSKSGTTLEPNVLFDYAWSKLPDASRYAVITDPGTPLAALGARAWLRTASSRTGPTSAGATRSSPTSAWSRPPSSATTSPSSASGRWRPTPTEAVELGMAMGEAARAGQDKVTIVVPEAFALVRAVGRAADRRVDRQARHAAASRCRRPSPSRRGPPLSRPRPRTSRSTSASSSTGFELAIPIAGHVLGIDPFDEPNVAESKANTNKVFGAPPAARARDGGRADGARLAARPRCGPGDYVSLQAYLPFGQDAALEALRRRVRDHLGGMAVTAGYGPRFLHSTGQLHKGGPNSVVAVQLVRQGAQPELAIPGEPYDFGTLIARPGRSATTRACSPTGGACCGWPSTTWARSAEPVLSDNGSRSATDPQVRSDDEDRHDRSRQDGRQHDRAADRGRPPGRRLRPGTRRPRRRGGQGGRRRRRRSRRWPPSSTPPGSSG